ncbi:MAG: hypothetical protein R6X02_34195 [Enhygromyxa sp.]
MVLDGIAFAAPAGLEDRSNYVHRAEAPREELSVELELPVGAATPAAEVIAEQREAMEGFLDAAFGVEAEGSTALAGAPARFMRYFIVDEGERKYGKTVVGNPGAGDYVRINWKGEVDGASVDASVDPVVASFRAASASQAPPGPGLRTCYAGSWAYELPERFSEPRTRIWTDGDSLRVQLSVPPPGAAPLELEGLIATDLDRSHTQLDRDDRELDQGTLAHLHQRGSLDREWAAYVALLRLDADEGAREVSIVATAPWSEDARLEQIVEALIASVALAEVSP